MSCLYCGYSVSSGANTCPHCRRNKPSGVVCKICDTRLKPQDAFSFHYRHAERESEPSYFHKSCIESHFSGASAFKCKTCSASLTGVRVIESPCHSCGEPEPFAYYNCSYCSLPIHPTNHEMIQGYKYSGGEEGYCGLCRYHSFCAASKYKEHAENIERGRKAKKLDNSSEFVFYMGRFILFALAIFVFLYLKSCIAR